MRPHCTCSLKSVVGLLAHENTDISIDVVQLLSDMTDSDAIEGAVEAGEMLVAALVGVGALEFLVTNLQRCD